MSDRSTVIEFMRAKAYRPLTAAELISVLGINFSEEKRFKALLTEMEQDGEIVRTRFDRYGVPERMNLVVGVFRGHEKGFGFVIPFDETLSDLFIPPGSMGGAMHGDRVVARRSTSRPSRGANPEGEIIRVLKRVNTRVTGTVEKHRGHGYVIPDEKRLPFAVAVAGRNLKDVRTGDKVVVEITEWPTERRGPAGKVVERLGRAGAPGVDVLSLIHRYGLPLRFPDEVLDEASAIPLEVEEGDLSGRLDLRGEIVFTIDGETAKDFDDAVSIEAFSSGPAAWRLGVHIADVAHYVAEGSKLDGEAYERGTSVYLVDRVVPMLPERLSNGICSLNPGQPRLTMSVFMDVDGQGRVIGHEIKPSVIQSRARLTYTEAWRVINQGGCPVDPGASAVVLACSDEEASLIPQVLLEMGRLAEVLRVKRLARGSIDFDLPEAAVTLDPRTGFPIEISKAERNPAHRLIEEFMLLANEVVAEHCSWLQIPFVYRVHEPPDAERLDALADILHNLGIPFRASKHPAEFQKALERVQGTPEEALVSAIMLRSMKQARYAAQNVGHFGLGARFYTHFTSPIRRYPDLMVHRVLKTILSGGINNRVTDRWNAAFPEAAAHCSVRERQAAEAEMETVKVKMAQYMSQRIGEVYKGIISGVTSFGFFVQLENLIEGLVHISTLTDDYYQYDEKAHLLLGERTGRRFRLGDAVEILVVSADPELAQIDFNLADAVL